jgi:hypothetical protein
MEDKKMRIPTFVTAAALVVLGTVALAQSVTYDFDRAANFSRYKTYAWVRGTNLADTLNHNRIVRAVDAQLSEKRFSQVQPGDNPDVLVAYHASFDTNLQINGSGWGGYRFGASRMGTASLDEITVGTLAVDIVEAGTKTIVWRGIASKELDTKASA